LPRDAKPFLAWSALQPLSVSKNQHALLKFRKFSYSIAVEAQHVFSPQMRRTTALSRDHYKMCNDCALLKRRWILDMGSLAARNGTYSCTSRLSSSVVSATVHPADTQAREHDLKGLDAPHSEAAEDLILDVSSAGKRIIKADYIYHRRVTKLQGLNNS
jgi:hypothetical protein